MLQVAKVLKSNGTDGGLLIGLSGIEAEDINQKEPVFIEFDGLPVPFFVLDIQPKGYNKAVVHLNDIINLEDAEEVVGRFVYVEGDSDEESDEEFIGWTVKDRGKVIGKVTGIEPIPGNLCILVGEIMIPLHEDFVISADEEKQELDLDLPSGLY